MWKEGSVAEQPRR